MSQSSLSTNIFIASLSGCFNWNISKSKISVVEKHSVCKITMICTVYALYNRYKYIYIYSGREDNINKHITFNMEDLCLCIGLVLSISY